MPEHAGHVMKSFEGNSSWAGVGKVRIRSIAAAAVSCLAGVAESKWFDGFDTAGCVVDTF